MSRLQVVDFLVDGKLSVIFGVVDVDFKRDILMLVLKVPT